MFGVTTPCVQRITAALRADFECLVFHATGIGGRSMEKLVDSGMIAGVIDLTTTEVADMLFGGVLPATDDRFGAIIRTRIPYVGSVGALDMVNFGAAATRARALPRPQVPRAQSAGDADAHHGGGERRIGRWIGERLNQHGRPGALPHPGGRRLALDAPGQPFSRSRKPMRRCSTRSNRRCGRPANRQLIRSAATSTTPISPPPSSPPSARCWAAPASAAEREVDMPRFRRAESLEKFRAMAARGEPIVGGGAGTGLSAKCEEAGGIDLIVIYNSGRYRMAGRGSLAGLMAYGDANAIVVDMASEVLPVVKRTPVLAGVNGTDPFRDMDVFLDEVPPASVSRACRISRRSA